MLANFEGLTFFEIFSENLNYLELIYNQIQEVELKEKKSIDLSGNESDNIIIRRMIWTMLLPIIKQKEDLVTKKLVRKLNKNRKETHYKDQKNILQEKLFDHESQYMLDPLLKLLMLSEEFKLSNLVSTFEGFK